MKCLDVSKSLFVKMFLSDTAIQEQQRQEQNQREMEKKNKKKKRKSIFGNKKKTHSTIASSFRSALGRLSMTLSKSNPHYIRCIKPNRIEADASAHWNAFDGAEVLSQLLKSGVLETVAMRQRGFPFRMEYSKFRRYLINRRVLSLISGKDRLNVMKHIKKNDKWCTLHLSYCSLLSHIKTITHIIRRFALFTILHRSESRRSRNTETKELSRHTDSVTASLDRGKDDDVWKE